MSQYIALDLGAESGRAIVGTLDGEKLALEEVYRFPNGPVRVHGSLYWDPLRLFNEMKQGLSKISNQYGRDFVSMGVDTWGVDYALLDRNGRLMGNPHSYRDSRTEGMMEEAFKTLSRQEIFEQTGGIQFILINTLFQLLSMARGQSPQLEAADTFLMMPDLFNYWFTGRKVCEFTNATTTQFYNSLTGAWATNLLSKLGIPVQILPEVILPGTNLGAILPEIGDEVGLPNLAVVAPATHDTASAAAAIPAAGDDFAWLSSGTWSLLGGRLDQPILTPEALAVNFSSYGGPDKGCLPLKNIMGLWLVQECRRVWSQAGETLSYDDLTQMAAGAKALTAVIDPDHASFLAPADMPAAIQQFCQDTNQPVPQSKGEILRTALEGLALRYRWAVETLESLLNRKLDTLHVVGGGSQNKLLCQFAADATQLPVVAGPVEATAIGNIAVQAIAAGQLASLDEARELIRRSFAVETYEPGNGAPWDEAYGRFLNLL
ncbi:MAG: rhamnulokinase [Chloroflexi bacterium]|nr:rhamnulokinase [Chloroflexota bacterium]